MTHPVTVGAVVLLLVNDHLLKAACPGPVTGKLSDVAGLAFTPALVAAVLCLLVPRVPARMAAAVGLVGTGLAFTWVRRCRRHPRRCGPRRACPTRRRTATASCPGGWHPGRPAPWPEVGTARD
ncbi:hypothetical protein [Dactylosporangium sp. NPDC048998]|uniref:hypothetical protein n=1 Tax=Dactylosporangium sp. NPDC048998 TaxID=3363976 RepID=UPI00371F75BE